MDISALRSFLSEENIKMHLGYMKNLKLKYSVSEKSIPSLSGQKNLKRSVLIKKSTFPADKVCIWRQLLPNIWIFNSN